MGGEDIMNDTKSSEMLFGGGFDLGNFGNQNNNNNASIDIFGDAIA